MQATAQEKLLKILQFRLERSQRRQAQLKRIENRFPWLRLGALLAGLLVVYLGFALLPRLVAWFVPIPALAGFLAVAFRHRQVIERMNRAETFSRLLASHIARLKLDWGNIPAPGPVAVPPRHPFAADLDITGSRSLHQLLDTAVSLGGSQRLAAWLLEPIPDSAAIARRQALVRELLERPGLCLRLELEGLLANPQPGERWDSGTLLRWLDRPHTGGALLPILVALGLLALVNISLFVLNVLGLLPALWIGSLAIYFALQSLRFRESSETFEEAYTLARQLGRLRAVLGGLEDYPYPPGSLLARLCAPLTRESARPSAVLRRVGWIVSAASLRNNPFLSLTLNTLAPWDLFFAYQLERVKRALRGQLSGWLEAWYELEALAALANYARLNPEATFPILLPPGVQPVLAGAEIGHPLIPGPIRVTNDFILEHMGEVIVITGSNMSGKSTFLRTLGVNLVLAHAGSLVAARELRIQPMRLFTSMNVVDSLNDGISFFYAEVSRLKALLSQLEAPQALPLFFLIDEIFRGTNNRERQLGSRAYTQALAGKNGVGLISTHDLELAHLAEILPAVHNYHFREDVQDGRMVFDFKIRPGASPTTNALRIMALAGLPVPSGAGGQNLGEISS